MKGWITFIMLLLAFGCRAQQDSAGSEVGRDALSALQKLPQFNNYPQGAPASADTVYIQQSDDSRIHIVGFGGMFIHYTETVDGYTLYRNDIGVLEYATRGNKGDLKGSGINARDPKDRSAADKLFLHTIPRHLRYEGKKLKHLIYKQYKWDESVYYGHQYQDYKKSQKSPENTVNDSQAKKP